MIRLKMIWWILTRKNICMIATNKQTEYDYAYETTTDSKTALTMSARLAQFCFSGYISKEITLKQMFRVHIPEED